MHEFSHHGSAGAPAFRARWCRACSARSPVGIHCYPPLWPAREIRDQPPRGARALCPSVRPVDTCRVSGRLAAWACAARAYVFAPCRGHRTPPQRLKTLISAPHRVGRGGAGLGGECGGSKEYNPKSGLRVPRLVVYNDGDGSGIS